MKRLKHFLLASCLLPGFLAAQGGANAYFLELAPDAQSAGMAGTGLAITDNGSTAIFHNASTIVFSQEVMGASYSYADINKDYSMHQSMFDNSSTPSARPSQKNRPPDVLQHRLHQYKSHSPACPAPWLPVYPHNKGRQSSCFLRGNRLC